MLAGARRARVGDAHDTMKPETLTRWTVENSVDLYGIRNWGAGYFDVNERGEIVVRPSRQSDKPAVSLLDIVSGLKDRGFDMPVLLRFSDILDSRLALLHDAFNKAMGEAGYLGGYRGVYPIKVNQQQQVVEAIARRGRRFHHGLEAGSKAELIAVLAYMDDPEALIVCNGYKDEEFVDLALHALKMGLHTVLVIEMPEELTLVAERAARLNVRPRLGVRCKLSTKAGGHWNDSGGDRSMFGLDAAQIITVVDGLRARGLLDSLEMLHYHLGSQIPNIRNIQSGCAEAARIYTSLVREGARMGYFNVGGGLAVDYDGSHTNFAGSSNYTVDEYAADIVEGVMKICDSSGVAHPTLVSESGRALVAHHSVLLFNVLGVSRADDGGDAPLALPDGAPAAVARLAEIEGSLSQRNLQESFHDAVFWRDECRSLFDHGLLSLRERALAQRFFWRIVQRIANGIRDRKYIPDELEGIDSALADVYHANFSVFQSLPDSWAIEQLFPVAPIHRLNECPTQLGIISDITCDCDGKITRFVDLQDVSPTLRLHAWTGGAYYLGVFLVGAYQETLGDLHNLFGDTNIVSLSVGENGAIEYEEEFAGDTVADVLTYVEYDPPDMLERVRNQAENAVRQGRITPQERREILSAYEAGLRGYTYFEAGDGAATEPSNGGETPPAAAGPVTNS